MKKVFMILASTLMVAAISCSKPADNTPSDDPEDPEQVDEDLITIDGKFDDWAKAQGVKTLNALAANNNIEIDGSKQRVDALKTLKAVADPYYIYLYVEVDMSKTYAGGVENWEGKILDPAHPGPIDIYIDADNKAETGGIQWVFSPCGWEYLFECGSFFAAEDGTVSEGEMAGDAYNFDVFTGADQTDVWAAGGPFKESILRDGMASAYRVKEGNTLKAEIAFIRAFLPKVTGSKVALGVIVQSTNWQLMGALPQAESAALAFTPTTFLTIDLPSE